MKIYVLFGPTASGKSAAAMHLAQLLPIEIISADSRQVFQLLDIGTAKPSIEDQELVRHHLIDIVSLHETYSAGRFRKDATSIVNDIYTRGNIPVVVGGSGLYIESLCEGLFEPGSNRELSEELLSIRAELSRRMDVEGRDVLFEELMRKDPVAARKYSDRNPRRITRALEFFEMYGVRLSDAHDVQSRENTFEVQYFVIDRDRDELNKRIDVRADQMWQAGLIDEIKSIQSKGFDLSLASLQTVGYKESLRYLDKTLEEKETIALIAQNTRRYAKRQRTWARSRLASAQLLRGSEEEIAHQMKKTILSNNSL